MMDRQLCDLDEKLMLRAIELARLGSGHVSPNPLVGCVIEHKGIIIGEGYHQEYGKPHAERNAINRVKDKNLLKSSTLYVTLEPCAHYGKTPPCADLILQYGIPKVVVGTGDPFAEVAGKGIKKLRDGGCEVIERYCQEKCIELNRRFITFHSKKRPYIILKWAQTADGFIDIDRTPGHFGHPTWITNDLSKIAVHKLRAEESAILVGTNTARKDNPSLTVREWSGHSPLRLVIDKELSLPASLALFNQSVPTVVYTSKELPGKINLEFKKICFDGHVVEEILQDLYERGILSLIVEGGQQLLNSFIGNNSWDEAMVFIGRRTFQSGIEAPVLDGRIIMTEEMDDSWMFLIQNG